MHDYAFFNTSTDAETRLDMSDGWCNANIMVLIVPIQVKIPSASHVCSGLVTNLSDSVPPPYLPAPRVTGSHPSLCRRHFLLSDHAANTDQPFQTNHFYEETEVEVQAQPGLESSE